MELSGANLRGADRANISSLTTVNNLGDQTVTDTSLDNSIVDLSQFYYYVRICMDGLESADLRFYSAVIFFE